MSLLKIKYKFILERVHDFDCFHETSDWQEGKTKSAGSRTQDKKFATWPGALTESLRQFPGIILFANLKLQYS